MSATDFMQPFGRIKHISNGMSVTVRMLAGAAKTVLTPMPTVLKSGEVAASQPMFLALAGASSCQITLGRSAR